MTDTSTSKAATKSPQGLIARFLSDTEIDTRLLGMLGALALIWGGFHLYGVIFNNFGAFLTPRNLWNLSVQTSSIGIMATGMVLVIVTRNIDLSVGSMIGVIAMSMGLLQVEVLPHLVGLGHWSIWIARGDLRSDRWHIDRRATWVADRLSRNSGLYCDLGWFDGLARHGVFICRRPDDLACGQQVCASGRWSLWRSWRAGQLDCWDFGLSRRGLYYLFGPQSAGFTQFPPAPALG